MVDEQINRLHKEAVILSEGGPPSAFSSLGNPSRRILVLTFCYLRATAVKFFPPSSRSLPLPGPAFLRRNGPRPLSRPLASVRALHQRFFAVARAGHTGRA